MRFGSVCSGIEAASCAWEPLGWKAAFFSEIEPFPSAVLAHHYPDTPNHGDMTKFKEWPDYAIDVLVGGTPCQSFSVAGLRKGLADPRGNLMLTYLAIADKYRPRWLVWENVPGVLSSNGGKDFGTFLGGLGELGYGFAYRVLDAQYFGVAQRRRRVFVVGCLGDWRAAAAVLFERDSLCGNPAPSRQARKTIASPVTTRSGNSSAGSIGTDEACGGYLQSWPAEVAPTLDAHYGDKMGLENQHINAGGGCSSVAMCLTTKTRIDAESETLIPMNGGVFSYAIARNIIGRKPENGGNGEGFSTESSYTLTKTDRHGVAHPISFGWQNSAKQGDSVSEQVTPTLDKSKTPAVAMPSMAVRRLTPRECERLQGFPDDYTFIPWRTYQEAWRKGISYETLLSQLGMTLRGPSIEDCPDGPRYKALGNSMAVPVMRWIGERIQMVDEVIQQKEQWEAA